MRASRLKWLVASIAGVTSALLVFATRSELVFAMYLDLCVVALASLGWVWLEDRRATRVERQYRRELAKSFPRAQKVRVRVEGWKRERLDINPALRGRR